MSIGMNSCLEKLKSWKGYPNFKAEPRVDWILSLAIPTLLEEKFNSKCQIILPEFPLRKGSLYGSNSNKSFKVDYYCLLENGDNYLIELITDMNSMNDLQQKYLVKAREKTVYEILQGILDIREKTNYKYRSKYDVYLEQFKKIGVIDFNNSITIDKSKKFKIIYITPCDIEVEGITSFKLKDLCEILKGSDDRFIREVGEIVSYW